MLEQVLDKFILTGKPLSTVLNVLQEKVISLHSGKYKGKALGGKHKKKLTNIEIGKQLHLPPATIQLIIDEGYCLLQYSFIYPSIPSLTIRHKKIA
jgi:hypothetical protein